MSKFRFKAIVGLVIFLCLVWVPLAYAQGESGLQLHSPGQQGAKPLDFVSITLADGSNVQNASDISLTPKFKLHFDKNVVNSLVWVGNSQCFSLISGNNENVPVNVTKVDDTVDFSQRQDIFIQPVNSLSSGTAYYLKVSPALLAKNGVSTLGGTTNGQGLTIAFKTGGAAVVQSSQSVGSAKTQPADGSTQTVDENISRDNTGSSTNAANLTASGKSANPGQQDSKDGKDQSTAGKSNGSKQANSGGATKDTGMNSAAASGTARKSSGNLAGWITTIGIILVAGWVGFEIYNRRKKGKSI